jgi:hypothetical protein
METITFKGNSSKIKTRGCYKHIEILSCTDKIVTPLINFVYLDGEVDSEPIDLNFKYDILNVVDVFFESSQDHECSIAFKLS